MTAQQLKNSILQMAVQGKLVPQDPNDEPASVLLERIKAEKEALIKSGKIKKSKKSSEIFRGASRTLPYTFCEQIGKEIRDISDEIPFEIPESWEWCRLDTIFQHNTGKALNSSKSQGIKMQYITTSNLYWNKFKLDKLKEMSFTENEVEKCTVTKGDLLVCEGGDIGRSAIWNYDYPMRIQNHIHRVRPYLQINIYFFYYIFYFYKNAGLIGGKGIGIQGLSTNALGSLFIPLPPLAEQKRIVAKIEELLPYIEKYEQAETKLTALNKSFSEMLKKSILQEAVQGKLVPQNPDDEPASILLERIRAEKQELIRQGKIKKSKHESIIVTRDKIPYEIPDSWAWCTLGSIINLVSGQDFNSCDFNVEGKGIPYLTGASNIIDEKIILNRWTDKPRCIANCGDLLIVCKGAGVGKMCILTEKKVHIARQIMSVQSTIVDIRYIKIFLEHNLILLRKSMQGVIPGISRDIILSMLFPLPPLAEQLRIVSKIEEIMSMINSISK